MVSNMGSLLGVLELFELVIVVFDPLFGKLAVSHHLILSLQLAWENLPRVSALLLADVAHVRVTE